MKIGYVRVSKSDDSQRFDLQMDALIKDGVKKKDIYSDMISGSKEHRPGLQNCLKALRNGDKLVVWSLDRLGRNLRHLINLIQELEEMNVSFKVLYGKGSGIDTSTPAGKMIFAIFGALAEFERELIRERTIAGIKAARARGRCGGRKNVLSKAQVRLAQNAMHNGQTVVTDLARQLNITRATLYRYIAPDGQLRKQGLKVMGKL